MPCNQTVKTPKTYLTAHDWSVVFLFAVAFKANENNGGQNSTEQKISSNNNNNDETQRQTCII